MEFKLNEFTRSLTRNETVTKQYHLPEWLSEAQKDVIVKLIMNANHSKLTVNSMKLGFKQAGCPHDVDEKSSKQLQNLVSRLNLKMPHHNKKQLEIADLVEYFQTLRGIPSASDSNKLHVIDEFTVKEGDVFIPMASFAMLQLPKLMKEDFIIIPKIILPIFTHIWQFILSLLSYFVCVVGVSSWALSRGNHYFLILKNGVVEQLVQLFRSRTLLSHRRSYKEKSLNNSIS